MALFMHILKDGPYTGLDPMRSMLHFQCLHVGLGLWQVMNK
jgi:hypothetical protein